MDLNQNGLTREARPYLDLITEQGVWDSAGGFFIVVWSEPLTVAIHIDTKIAQFTSLYTVKSDTWRGTCVGTSLSGDSVVDPLCRLVEIIGKHGLDNLRIWFTRYFNLLSS